MSSPLSRRTALALPLLAGLSHAAPFKRWRVEETRRIPAPEAAQSVSADANHLYAIGNHVIAKYDKASAKRLSIWQCERGKPLIHLNSGIVRNGELYCAHSNYPEIPMTSSIEVWDTKTLRHLRTHSFGIFSGSATWLDFFKGSWYVTFAHYSNRAAEPNRDPRWTTLIQFDAEWRRLQSWVFPDELVSKLGQYSISGGVFTPGGTLLCTGHDNPEIYALAFPDGGSTLVLQDTFPAPIKGQGIALDPAIPNTLYGIDRPTREIVVMRLHQL